jgi:hypothetical protein
MPQKTAKCRQLQPNKWGLYTPEPVRGRVIARHVTGQSNRQIAVAEGIDRETVGRILSQREVAELTAQYRSRLLAMVPKAIAVYDAALSSDDERLRVETATKLLEGFQVLPKGGIEQQPAPEMDSEQQKHLVLGQMLEMVLTKKQHYAIALPPELDALENEVRKRIEGPLPVRQR